MDICVCKDNKRIQGMIRAYVIIASLAYIALCAYAFMSEGFDISIPLALIALLSAIMVGVALWRKRAGHSFRCSLLWAYVSPVAELHKTIRSLS